MNSKSNSVSIPFRTFEHNLEHSISYAEVKKSEPKFLKQFLYRISRYVKKLKLQNPDITKQEIEEIFAKDLEELSEASYCGTKISQSFMNYVCYDLFNKSPDCLNSFLSLLEEIKLPFSELQTLPRSNFAITQLYYAAKLKDEFDASDSKDIHLFLKEQLDNITPNVKDNIYQAILSILRQLDKFDLLTSYLDINQKKMEYLGFSEYAKVLNSDNPNNKSEKLLELFSAPDFLESQSPYNLLTLYSFWVNRYYKELDTYLEAMFTIRDLDLIPSMIKGEFKSPSKEDLKKELVKLNLFYDPTRFVLETQKAEKLLQKNESEYDISENIYSFHDDTFLYYIQNEYGDTYKKFFDTYIPSSSNDVMADAKHYFQLYNPIFATCGLKDATMLYLLIGLKTNSHYLNAGVIPERVYSNFTKGDLGRFVGIGINNGMTDTFLLHIKKSTLLEFANSYLVDNFFIEQLPGCYFPVFEEKVDYTNGLYSVPVLAPMTEEQKKLISSYKIPYTTSNLRNKKIVNPLFVNHLSRVMDYKTAYKKSQTFINIETGEIISSKRNDAPDFSDR